MAQSSQLFWHIAIIGIAGFAALCVVVVTSRIMKRRTATKESSQPFTLQELRDLRLRGDITEDEYSSMKEAIFGIRSSPSSEEEAVEGDDSED